MAEFEVTIRSVWDAETGDFEQLTGDATEQMEEGDADLAENSDKAEDSDKEAED